MQFLFSFRLPFYLHVVILEAELFFFCWGDQSEHEMWLIWPHTGWGHFWSLCFVLLKPWESNFRAEGWWNKRRQADCLVSGNGMEVTFNVKPNIPATHIRQRCICSILMCFEMFISTVKQPNLSHWKQHSMHSKQIQTHMSLYSIHSKILVYSFLISCSIYDLIPDDFLSTTWCSFHHQPSTGCPQTAN